MTHSLQRAESVPSPARRQMITLAPALAFSAALAPPAVAGTPDPLDMAVLYAASRFDEAALAFLSSANEKEALLAFQSMRACVGALSFLPARSAAAIAAKRRVGGLAREARRHDTEPLRRGPSGDPHLDRS